VGKMVVARRTFEAEKHPKGSPERVELNKSWVTSEYMPSYKYGVLNADGTETPFCYRTKREAEEKARQDEFNVNRY